MVVDRERGSCTSEFPGSTVVSGKKIKAEVNCSGGRVSEKKLVQHAGSVASVVTPKLG